MNFINISKVIIVIFALISCFYSYSEDKYTHITNNIYRHLEYNKYYVDLAYEAYSKKPNIVKELMCIFNFYRNKSVSDFFIIDGIRLYAKSVRMTDLIGNLKNIDGDIGTHYYQMKHYNQLIKMYDNNYGVENICEVGFQLGVGAITMITSVKHDVNYYGFDLGRNHSKNLFRIISPIFLLHMIWGYSSVTIPNFISTNESNNKCDVIHIDACHTQEAVFNDIKNMRRISHHKSLLLLDDVYIDSSAIIKANKNKYITNIECFKWKPYCIAEYL